MLENRSKSLKKSAETILRLGYAAISSYHSGNPENAQAAFIALQPFTLPGDYVLSIELFKILSFEGSAQDKQALIANTDQIILALEDIFRTDSDREDAIASKIILKQAINVLNNSKPDFTRLPGHIFFDGYRVSPPYRETTFADLKSRLEQQSKEDPNAFFSDLENYITTKSPSYPKKQASPSSFWELFEGQLSFNEFFKKLLPLINDDRTSPKVVQSCFSLIFKKLQVSSSGANTSEFLFQTLNTLISAEKFELAYSLLENVSQFDYAPFNEYNYHANLFFNNLHTNLLKNSSETSCLFALKAFNWFLKTQHRDGYFSRFVATLSKPDSHFLQTLTHFQPSNSVLAGELALLFEQLYQISDKNVQTALANRLTGLHTKHTANWLLTRTNAENTINTAIHARNGWLTLKIFLGISVVAGIVFIGLSGLATILSEPTLNFFLNNFYIGLYLLGASITVSLAAWVFEGVTSYFANFAKRGELAEQTLAQKAPNSLAQLPQNYVAQLNAAPNINVREWCDAYQIKTDTLEELKIAFTLNPLLRTHLKPANDMSLLASYFEDADEFRGLQRLLNNNVLLLDFLMYNEQTLQTFIQRTLFDYLQTALPGQIAMTQSSAGIWSTYKQDEDPTFKRTLLEKITANPENIPKLVINHTLDEITLIFKYTNPSTSKKVLDFIFNDKQRFEAIFKITDLGTMNNLIRCIQTDGGLTPTEQAVYLDKLSNWLILDHTQFKQFLCVNGVNELSEDNLNRLVFLAKSFPTQKDQIIHQFISLPLSEVQSFIKINAVRGKTEESGRFGYWRSLSHHYPEYLNLFRGLALITPDTLSEKEWKISLDALQHSLTNQNPNNERQMRINTFILSTLSKFYAQVTDLPLALSDFYDKWLKNVPQIISPQLPPVIPSVFVQNPSPSVPSSHPSTDDKPPTPQ